MTKRLFEIKVQIMIREGELEIRGIRIKEEAPKRRILWEGIREIKKCEIK